MDCWNAHMARVLSLRLSCGTFPRGVRLGPHRNRPIIFITVPHNLLGFLVAHFSFIWRHSGRMASTWPEDKITD